MSKSKSLYSQAADDGLVMGIYLSALFVIAALSTHFSLLSLLVMTLIIGIPVVNYIRIRRTHITGMGQLTFSTLWMEGILMYIFASLICGVTTYVYLQFIEPGFIYTQAKSALVIYESVPELKDSEIVTVMKQAIDQKLLPSPIQFVFQMMWLTTFLGSILSIFIALIAKAIRIKTTI